MMERLAQEPTVLAMVGGQSFTELPADLFIPPDALLILLDSFTGPLDLLLYLIRRQRIDMMNIPMAIITEQYMQYIALLEARRVELAADYLVMAAMLVEIKSSLLLPSQTGVDDEEEVDPRLALVKRLQVYEQIKQAASCLDALPRMNRDVFQVQVEKTQAVVQKTCPEVSLSAIAEAMQRVLQEQDHWVRHQVKRELFSVHERMTLVLAQLKGHAWVLFNNLLEAKEGRAGVVVTLLAVLELVRQSLVMMTEEGIAVSLCS